MKEIKKQLAVIAISPIVITLCIVALFETEVLVEGVFANKQPLEFVVLTIMEIITIVVIPLAFRLFQIKKIRNDFETDGNKALQKWGSLRLTLIGDTMVFNTVGYYLFAHVAFAYMAIIHLIVLIMLFPTTKRCKEESGNK